MKKKGFVFIETMIVIVVLTFGMIMIYSSFSSILNSSKRRVTYDDVAYIYRSYYIQDFISSLNIEKFVDKNLSGNNKITEFTCENNDSVLYKVDSNKTDSSADEFPISQQIKKLMCSQMFEKFNVFQIYLTRYNVSELKRCTTSSGRAANNCNQSIVHAISGLKYGTVHYLRTLSSTASDNDSYRLIITYNDRQIEANDKVSKTKVNGTYRCPDGYFGEDEDDEDSMCYRILNRTFYSNIKMIAKSKL